MDTSFIHDRKLLKVSDPVLYHSFSKGYFVTRKTDAAFSKIAFDHVHEQNNKIIKSRAGFLNLLNNDDTVFLCKMEIGECLTSDLVSYFSNRRRKSPEFKHLRNRCHPSLGNTSEIVVICIRKYRQIL